MAKTMTAKTMPTCKCESLHAKHEELPIGVSTLAIIAHGYAYADKYPAGSKAVTLIGVEFERLKRVIVEFAWEQA